MHYIKNYDNAALHHYKNRRFDGVLTNEKLNGTNGLNAIGTISKKINVAFIDHFWLGKYSFSQDTFWTYPKRV